MILLIGLIQKNNLSNLVQDLVKTCKILWDLIKRSYRENLYPVDKLQYLLNKLVGKRVFYCIVLQREQRKYKFIFLSIETLGQEVYTEIIMEYII